VDCHGAPASCQFSAVPHYLKLIRSMGVGPCEWSEVKSFSRIPRQMAKGLAGLAVLVASAVPLVALAGTASAATAPTLACSVASSAASPTCSGGYAIVGQGFTGNFYAAGTNFSSDQAVGGNVTLTTTATGVSFSNVSEFPGVLPGSGYVTATINTSSATPTGFYPLTLTDDNGTATLPVGLGIDNGPQITTISGNAGTVAGAPSTVTVTGTGLEGATPVVTATTGANPGISAVVSNNAGTSLTFTVNNATVGFVAGTDTLTVSSTQGGESGVEAGVATSSYTANAAATALSITSVTPSELGVPTVNSSTVTVTVSGTGFELGAVLTITPYTGVTVANPTFVNSTTMTEQVTVATGTIPGQLPVSIVNPDTTHTTPADLIGINEPATANTSGPAAPVAPALSLVSGFLAPGTASIIHVTGTSTFPITTTSTVSVKQANVTNVSESLTGKVVSVDATNDATIQVQVPRYATSVTTAAVLAGAVTLTVTDASGILPATGAIAATIVDGKSTEQVTGTLNPATGVLSGIQQFGAVNGTQFAHAAGVTVEFPFPASAAPGTTNVLSVSNGTNTESSNVGIELTAGSPPAAYPVSTYTASGTGATVGTLDPGTYSINAYLPGFGYATGSAVTFQSYTTGNVANSDGVTGTVTVVNGNTATIAVTVPKVRSGDTGDHLTASATPGQNAITLQSITNSSVAGPILVGDSLTIEPDAFYLTPETVTVTSVSGLIVGITPALADNHTGGAAGVGAEVIDNSDPQSINDRVQATITNGAGGVEVDPSFFAFTTAGTILSTQLASPATVTGGIGIAPFGASNEVGAGANGATINLALSQATDLSAPADWTGSSTNTGVTFGPITNDSTGDNITTTINVAPGTAAAASVPISFTDGLETFSGTIAIVAGPTVSAVTTVGNLTAGGTETIGVTGTNFVATPSSTEMTCSTSDPTVGCAVTAVSPTNTSTTATVVLTASPGMLNGTFALTLTYSAGAAATYGAGTLTGAFTVSGQPVITAIAPASIAAGGTVPSPTIPLVVTGTAFSTGVLTCSLVATHPDGSTVSGIGTSCSAVAVSATTSDITGFTYTGYGTGSGGDSVVFTVGTATSTANTPAVAIVSDPLPSFMISSSVLGNYTADDNIAAGSAAVPFYIIGAGYSAGATVTFATVAAGGTPGTATITSVTPNGVYGTVTVPAPFASSPATTSQETATVTNPNGGAGVLPTAPNVTNAFNAVAAPTVTSPITGTPKAILDGVPTTVTITGTGFVTGAVVTGAVAGVDTFGPTTVSNPSNPLDKCTGTPNDCTQIKVLVTPVSFSGSTAILDGLVVTNPIGAGSATEVNSITVNPVPAVTGVYYVPTFTANREITITGTGFQSGIAASSANPDYTVLAVASTPTTVTLLVTTDSNATAGTSSTVTLTNVDGGSGTFTLNGGPNPNTATPAPKALAAHGVAHLGKTSSVKVSGTHFYGQPKVTSNDPGVKVTVNGDTGKLLSLRITTKKTSKTGVHTLTITFKNGESTHVKYNTTK
jgi:hypothetical protein